MTTAAGQLPAIRIFLLDDDEAVGRMIERQLVHLGFEVHRECDPMMALEAYVDDAYDLVICDLLMPGMDGHEFLEELRDRGVSTPFILLAGNPEVHDVVDAHRNGAADFLVKPVSRRELGKVVRRVVKAKPRVATAPVAIDCDAGRDVRAPSKVAVPAPTDMTSARCIQNRRDAAKGKREPARAPVPEDPMEAKMRRLELAVRGRLRSNTITLPVPPKVIDRIRRATEADDPDPDLVFGLLEAHPLLGRAVLRLAMTPEFRGHDDVVLVREAAARLGARRSLACATSSVFGQCYNLEGTSLRSFAAELWLVHYVTSVAAEEIARALDCPGHAGIQAATLFSQVGELAILRVAADLWPDLLDDGRPVSCLRELVVRMRFDASAILLNSWHLSQTYSNFAKVRALGGETSDLVLRRWCGVAKYARLLSEHSLGRHPFEPDEPETLAAAAAAIDIDQRLDTQALMRRAFERARFVIIERS